MTEPEHDTNEEEAAELAETPDVDGHEAEEEAEAEEPTVTDVPEPDQEPAEGPTPEDLELAFKKIERSHKTYVRAVSNALEEAAQDLLPCPLCEGAVPSFVNRHDAGKVDEETQGAVYAFLSLTPPTSLNKSRVNETCATCSGLGELLTGSRVPAWETKTCPDCNGAGFVGPGNPKFSPPVEAVVPNGTEAVGGEGVNLEFALAAIKGTEG